MQISFHCVFLPVSASDSVPAPTFSTDPTSACHLPNVFPQKSPLIRSPGIATLSTSMRLHSTANRPYSTHAILYPMTGTVRVLCKTHHTVPPVPHVTGCLADWLAGGLLCCLSVRQFTLSSCLTAAKAACGDRLFPSKAGTTTVSIRTCTYRPPLCIILQCLFCSGGAFPLPWLVSLSHPIRWRPL